MRGQPLQSGGSWVNQTYARLLSAGQTDDLRTCVQRAGEVFYLPASWPHLTLNLETTIGVGAQQIYSSKK